MHHTSTIPQHHIPTRLFVDISPKVFIWCKNDRLFSTGKLSMIFWALEDVQMISLNAFIPAEQLI
jgi:hypothetical protein